MYYKEFLRVRKPIFVYTVVLSIGFALTSLITLWLPMTVGTESQNASRATDAAAALVPLPWPALLAVAAFFAAIVATGLGSTLSQENNGHLELALTKPYSRARYATTAIAVDLAAILVAEFVALVFIVLHIAIFHRTTNELVSGPDPIFNALRFMLFPLAWYGIIAGASAGLRGKAGIVQGLIWPVALVLAALRDIPATGAWQTWHNVFVALNAFNPLIYVAFHEQASGTTIHLVGATALPAALGAAVLAGLLIAGWLAATWQWRRVEA